MSDWTRREVLRTAAAAGVGSAVFARALTALAQEAGDVTSEMIDQAAWVAGLEFTEEERELMLDGVSEALSEYAVLREVELDNSVPPAVYFSATAGTRANGSGASPEGGDVEGPGAGTGTGTGAKGRGAGACESAATIAGRHATRPSSDEDLAFMPASRLGALVRSRQVSSEELTRLYLERLERYDPDLRCVITLTPELALDQARRADREIAAGRYRGPLHGIPWGAKDLLAVPGYRTTWGANPYRDQVRRDKATVASRLEEAGAVLVAKLSVGALAWSDVWFDATTKNPWNTAQGSSGSSAGPGAATAAGLVGFAIGTETWGSIVSPSTRCGVTGLRPTFGRVSRHGAMALSWSMDKIGPMARSAADCALVFGAIHGSDGLDPTAVDRPFRCPAGRDPSALRVGYVPELFEDPGEPDLQDLDPEQAEEARAGWRREAEWRSFDRRTLETLRESGFRLVPVQLPTTYPVSPLSLILTAEASAAFDELTRSGRDDQLVKQVENAWPNVFRQGQLIPAVEYIRANRIRTLLMRDMEQALAAVDVFVAPTFGGGHLLLTNLTGHPAVVLPNGFRAGDGTPTSITITGRLFGETDLLAVACAYQEATDFHLRRPPLDA
jgi:Asp-tRNA(Asn)/Glu-tRNA(Gln) amidotransferase A subunit family amidase